ncbi:MAG: hypothetical protein COA94_01105 [Rickettsiales bacterium]|nr:MAG: hypothetical protein COA94_01105 [Rickettsiales bacterium]
MKLSNLTQGQLAKLINASPQRIHKYLYGGAIPKEKAIHEIYIKTLGSVRPEDFYKETSDIFEQELLKKQAIDGEA